MNFGGLIFLLVAHYFCGRGLLRLLRVELKPVPAFCMAMMLGVPLVSLTPCFLQLMGIAIDTVPIIVAVAVMTALFSMPLVIKFRRLRFSNIVWPSLYELPFIAVVVYLLCAGVWRGFYYPPYARDMLSGPELLAEYAVREKTMISSVFTVDLQSSNNYFKSPFITGLQIIYKSLVCPFGQVWLSVLSVSFIVWLHTLLRERVHGWLAGLLLMLFMCIPELFAYSYVLLYDYSNMVFFFAGFYFLSAYFKDRRGSDFVFSAVLFGLATYIRTETLLLVLMVAPLVVVYSRRQQESIKALSVKLAVFTIVPVLFYVLCIDVFIRLFVPLPFDVAGQLNPDLGNMSLFFERLRDVQTLLIFSDRGIGVYGHFIFLFYALVIADLIFARKYNPESVTMLYGVAVVLVGLPLLGYLLPVVDLHNTTKRGLFKMLPLMLLYMANSGLVRMLGAWIATLMAPKPAPVTAPAGKVKPGVVAAKGKRG
jgi:hypothetical protein